RDGFRVGLEQIDQVLAFGEKEIERAVGAGNEPVDRAGDVVFEFSHTTPGGPPPRKRVGEPRPPQRMVRPAGCRTREVVPASPGRPRRGCRQPGAPGRLPGSPPGARPGAAASGRLRCRAAAGSGPPAGAGTAPRPTRPAAGRTPRVPTPPPARPG